MPNPNKWTQKDWDNLLGRGPRPKGSGNLYIVLLFVIAIPWTAIGAAILLLF